MNVIASILRDSRLDGAKQTDALLVAQASLADLGARELAALADDTSELAIVDKAAGHLSRIAGHEKEKHRVSEHCLDNPVLRKAAALLVPSWTTELVDRAIALHHDSPGDPGLAHVMYEMATFFPDRLRPFADELVLDETREMLFSGTPDAGVDAVAAAYRKRKEVALLERIGFAHTARAAAVLKSLRAAAGARHRDSWEASIENAGVLSDGKTPARTSESFLGYIAANGMSPHVVGGVAHGPVPKCIKCDTPADRLLVLKASALPFTLSARHDPTFFFYGCECNVLENAVVQFMADGRQEVPLGFEHPGPSGTNLFATERSMVLEPHPNQRGYGATTSGGLGRHQVGGAAPWITLEQLPHCPGCSEPMVFLAAIDSGLTSFERLRFPGTVFGFWCDQCSISWTRRQS